MIIYTKKIANQWYCLGTITGFGDMSFNSNSKTLAIKQMINFLQKNGLETKVKWDSTI